MAKLYARLNGTGPVTKREERGAWINPKGKLVYDDNENVQVTVPASRAVAIASDFASHIKSDLHQDGALAEIYPAVSAPANAHVRDIAIVSLDVSPCPNATLDKDLADLSQIAGGASAYKIGGACRIYSDIARKDARLVVIHFNHNKVLVREGSSVTY